MPAKVTTAGMLLINAALPAELQQDDFDLDKKGIQQLLQRVAERFPDKYKEIADRLMKIGQFAVETTSNSLSLASVDQPMATRARLGKLREQIDEIASSNLKPAQKDKRIIELVAAELDPLQNELFQDALRNSNPLALQAQSGSRGNATSFRQIVAGDGLTTDHMDRVMSVPILHGYAQGLDPAEYMASSFGARTAAYHGKRSVADAGFLSKQLGQATHRLMVTTEDCGTTSGVPVPGGDKDLIGSVLASDAGDFKAGQIVSPEMSKKLRDVPEVVVRSAMTCAAADGICARCAGVRDRGRLPDIGDAVGLMAAHSIGERISQGLLGSKHTASFQKGKVSGSSFKDINAATQFTEQENMAPVAPIDGSITKIEAAPQGGSYIYVGNNQMYVPVGQTPMFKRGDSVEAGDILTDGPPNVADVVRHKGIGDGRLALMNHLTNVLAASGVKPHRRNLETVVRGLVNHVRITPIDGYDGLMVDDVVPFDRVMRGWEPREGFKRQAVSASHGMYLEKPTLHYTVGTRVTPKVAQRLSKSGVTDVDVHSDPPPFEPEPVRVMESALHDEDWMTRLSGSFLQKGFEDSVLRGREASPRGTSYVPALAQATDFGKNLPTKGTY